MSESKSKKIIEYEDFYIFQCPHCDEFITVHKNELFCKIFRHAVYKDSGKQISPHSSKEICDKLVLEDKVMGCAKPFQVVINGSDMFAEVCDYI